MFPSGAFPLSSELEGILKNILATPWTEMVHTLIATYERLARHNLIRDPNGPTRVAMGTLTQSGLDWCECPNIPLSNQNL